MGLKRFITYLYEYKSGQKGKNAGFIRVDLRGKEVRLEMHICNVSHLQGEGKAYLLAQNEDMFGICLGNIKLIHGGIDERYIFSCSNILDSNFDFSEVIGFAVCFENGYLASAWKDEMSQELTSGSFRIWSPSGLSDASSIIPEADVKAQQEVYEETREIISVEQDVTIQGAEEQKDENLRIKDREYHRQKHITYEKIQLTAIRDLPLKNGHLCNNSFLIHGFFNYHYLVLKKEKTDDREIWSLGVPGVFEQPEKMIAAMFEFTEFEPLLDNEDEIGKIENQEQKEGTFGAWFTKLKS